jgi:hypothetical protein
MSAPTNHSIVATNNCGFCHKPGGTHPMCAVKFLAPKCITCNEGITPNSYVNTRTFSFDEPQHLICWWITSRYANRRAGNIRVGSKTFCCNSVDNNPAITVNIGSDYYYIHITCWSDYRLGHMTLKEYTMSQMFRDSETHAEGYTGYSTTGIHYYGACTLCKCRGFSRRIGGNSVGCVECASDCSRRAQDHACFAE